MMPTKFSKSFKQVDKVTKKLTVTHDYMKKKTKDELFETINKDGVNRKLRSKCIRELDRRGVKIVWKKQPSTKLEL